MTLDTTYNKKRERFINLNQWQSLGLVMDNDNIWFSYYSTNKHKKELMFDTKSLQNISIKIQIESILNNYGWIPIELNYKNIKSSMKQHQIGKYGKMVEQFINEYNEEITSMNLSLNEQMPQNYDTKDILSLSRFVNDSSPHSIKQLLQSMDEESLKQLLMNNMNYYLNNKNRQKYINNMNTNIRTHHNILKSVKQCLNKKMNKNKIKYNKNVFDKLPLMLSSYIVSFCDFHSFNNVSICCHTLYKASNKLYAKTEIKINARELAKKLTLSGNEINKYFKVPSLVFTNLYRDDFAKRFGKHFNDIIECNKLRSISMDDTMSKLAEQITDVISEKNIKCISRFNKLSGEAMDLPYNLLYNLEILSISKLNTTNTWRDVQYLLINNMEEGVPVDVSNGDDDITKYLRPHSKLKHLYIYNIERSINKMNCCGMLIHPIFWLWNIPTLQSATLCVRFSVNSNFRKQCEKMLLSPLMMKTAKLQKTFNDLTLFIENDYISNDWKHLFLWISKLYPNLKRIHYQSSNQYNFKGELMEDLDWKLCFENLEYIKLNVPISMDNSMNLLETMRRNKYGSFKNVKVLQLNKIISPYKKIINSDYTQTLDQASSHVFNVNIFKIQRFINEIGVFLNAKPKDLISLSLNIISNERYRHKVLHNQRVEEIYWNSFKKYLNVILETSVDNIFDGYLEFGLPDFAKRYKPKWNKNTQNESLKIAQIITKIQTKINEKNENDEKLIMKLNGLKLYKNHSNFLQFWFNDKHLFQQNTSDYCSFIQFVAF